MEPHFTNEVIDINSLPKYEVATLESLDPKYRKIMWFNFWISTLIFTIIVMVPAFVLFWGEWQVALFLIPVLVIQGISLLLLNKLFRSRKYAIREKDIIYKSGLINHDTTILSFNKIQHVSIHESWLARRMALAKIELYSTGGSLSIPGLPLEMAQQIKALILQKISQSNAVDAKKNSYDGNDAVINEYSTPPSVSNQSPLDSNDDEYSR